MRHRGNVYSWDQWSVLFQILGWRVSLWNLQLRLGWRSQSDPKNSTSIRKLMVLLSTVWDLEGKMRAGRRGKGLSYSTLLFLLFFPSPWFIPLASFVTVMQNQRKASESMYPNQCWHNSSTSLAGWSEHMLCLRSSTHECLSQHLKQKLHFLVYFSFLTPSLNICLLLSSRKQDQSE